MKVAARHRPFYVGAAVAGGMALLSAWLGLPAVVLAADGFFIVYLVLSLWRIFQLDAAYLKQHASADDEPVVVIFAVTAGAVIAALLSLFVVVNRAAPHPFELTLALLAVPLGWLTIHTMTALHYMHLYWARSDSAKAARGLDFPKTPEPDTVDFLYFSLVIGMTAQTSDVAITSRGMRRVNLLHAVTSFFFNTVLVAAAVNVAVNLAN